ncbi:hypothetical protein V8C40DRAFT_25482 [Trichoderma camerunense]
MYLPVPPTSGCTRNSWDNMHALAVTELLVEKQYGDRNGQETTSASECLQTVPPTALSDSLKPEPLNAVQPSRCSIDKLIGNDSFTAPPCDPPFLDLGVCV